MCGVKLQEARRDGIYFDGLIDGGKDDDVVFGHLSDDAAAGEAGDDFVFALKRLSGGSWEQWHGGKENRN